jgi:hypothetical protein
MGLEDRHSETPAQWMEHSDAWRYAHLDLAPSEYWRREALAAHERAEQAQVAALHDGDGPELWQAWLRLPLLTRQAILAVILVALVAAGALAS